MGKRKARKDRNQAVFSGFLIWDKINVKFGLRIASRLSLVGNIDKTDTILKREQNDKNKYESPDRELRPGSAWWEVLTKWVPSLA